MPAAAPRACTSSTAAPPPSLVKVAPWLVERYSPGWPPTSTPSGVIAQPIASAPSSEPIRCHCRPPSWDTATASWPPTYSASPITVTVCRSPPTTGAVAEPPAPLSAASLPRLATYVIPTARSSTAAATPPHRVHCRRRAARRANASRCCALARRCAALAALPPAGVGPDERTVLGIRAPEVCRRRMIPAGAWAGVGATGDEAPSPPRGGLGAVRRVRLLGAQRGNLVAQRGDLFARSRVGLRVALTGVPAAHHPHHHGAHHGGAAQRTQQVEQLVHRDHVLIVGSRGGRWSTTRVAASHAKPRAGPLASSPTYLS